MQGQNKSAHPKQFDLGEYSRRFIEYGKNDAESQKIGVELVYGTLPQGYYNLTAYASDTTDAFTAGGIYVSGGRMKVVKLYAPDKPKPVVHSIYFYANGGTGSVFRDVKNGEALGTLPTPSRTGYAFLGWYTSASGGTKISSTTVATGDRTYYARWEAVSYSIYFYANGGTGSVNRSISAGSSLGTLPTPVRSGYLFDGWYTSSYGGTRVYSTTVPSASTTYYAHWSFDYSIYYTYCTVTFNPNGAASGTTIRSVLYGSSLGTLPVPVRAGYVFDGWYTSASGGTKIYSTTHIYSSASYYAHWTAIAATSKRLYSTDGAAWRGAAAATFDGWLADRTGAVKGTIAIKLSKANANGKAKAVATICIAGENKLSVKGYAGSGSLWADSARGTLKLDFFENTISGTFGEFYISGARNLFTSKSATEKADAARALASLPTAFNIVYPDGGRYSALSVSIDAKGKVKVTGTLASGAKANVAVQLIMGDEAAIAPVALSKNASFAIWFSKNGSVSISGISGAVTGSAKLSKSSYTLKVSTSPAVSQSLYVSGGKLKVPSRTIAKVEGLFTTVKIKDNSINPNEVKLTYNAKTGVFKGSCKIRETVDGKEKTRMVSFSGVMAGNVGYGTAKTPSGAIIPVSIR